MFNWLRRELGIAYLTSVISKLDFWLRNKEVENPETILLRHLLSSIDVSDVREKQMSVTERKEYCAMVAAFYEKVILPEVKRLVLAQEDWMCSKSENEKQFLFARGTINGLFLLEEQFKKYHMEHLQYLKDSKEGNSAFDKQKILQELLNIND